MQSAKRALPNRTCHLFRKGNEKSQKDEAEKGLPSILAKEDEPCMAAAFVPAEEQRIPGIRQLHDPAVCLGLVLPQFPDGSSNPKATWLPKPPLLSQALAGVRDAAAICLSPPVRIKRHGFQSATGNGDALIMACLSQGGPKPTRTLLVMLYMSHQTMFLFAE